MRVVRIFLSTPNDVAAERTHAAELIRDINDTMQFLAPDQDVRFELVGYDTHAYPDIGAGTAQEVIDAQLPVDYDLYLGIMWKRAGTSTGDAVSGTAHEFEQALAHKTARGWPLIFFFFCNDRIDFPQSLDEVEQLQRVLTFRARVNELGLIVTYESAAQFRDALRVRLLRALADILFKPGAEQRRAAEPRPTVPPEAARRLTDLAEAYDRTRVEMPSGAERTREMTRLFNAMVELAPLVRPLLDDLEASRSAGERLAAIAILYAFPDPAHLTWLATRLDNPALEQPFIGYQAASALGQAARTLSDPSDRPAMEAALDQALTLAQRMPGDPARIRALQYARTELEH